ncbi:MAG: molybdopterin cofactor-binding domain-containing protein [Myxococcota bacterium]
MKLSRRGFLKAGAAAGGALLLEVWPEPAGAADLSSVMPDARLRIGADDVVTLVLASVEMGQGTATMQAQLVAEELEVRPELLRLELATNDRRYDNPALGFQLTGGSTSTAVSWEPYRRAGAVARELLVAAAAKTWGVPKGECHAHDGAVVHGPSARRLRYGAVAGVAATLRVPDVEPKRKGFTLVGRSIPRVDSQLKVTGRAEFGLDVKVPGMKVAVLVRSPVPGGSVASIDDAATKALGDVQVVPVSRGVAVVGATTFHALRGAKALVVKWNDGPLASFDSASHRARLEAAARGPTGRRVKNVGDAPAELARATRVLEAEYFAPYLAHAPMEPQNATVHVRDDGVEIWAPTQGPMVAADQVSRLLGVPLERVKVHQTWVGGGFGRRISQDYVLEAAEVSKAIGAPVKVVWTREDDLRHSPYRPAALHRVRGALDAQGRPLAWHHRVASQSIIDQVIPDFASAAVGGSFLRGLAASLGRSFMGGDRDNSLFEGVDSLPYELPHLAVDALHVETGVPVMFWRSVGHSHTAFATESFVDELAHAAGVDPFEYRRALLARHHRHRWVLELAAEKVGWKTPPPPGVGRGLAVHESFSSYAAAAAEVRVQDGAIVVERLVLAIDCGRVVNPDLVRAQLESAALFGLSATLKQRITFAAGRVEQSNFHDFAPLRLAESPRIETFIRENEAAPSGVGEPGVPVIAPAVANAVFALTGQRLRSLPLSLG